MLQDITYDNHDSPFAEGGFGSVFAGKLNKELPICVKVAHVSSSNQGDKLRRVGVTLMILQSEKRLTTPPLS